MTDVYKTQTLPELLDELTCLVRKHISAAKPMSLDSLAGFHARMRDAHWLSLESGLISHAKSGQIGPAIGAKMGELIDLRESLAREQLVIQAALDGAEVVQFASPWNPAGKGKAERDHRRASASALPTDGGDAA